MHSLYVDNLLVFSVAAQIERRSETRVKWDNIGSGSHYEQTLLSPIIDTRVCFMLLFFFWCHVNNEFEA